MVIYVWRRCLTLVFESLSGPFQGPEPNPRESRSKRPHKRQQRAKARPREQKWSRSKRNAARNIADVKIELGPMPFDPKY